MMFNKRVAAIVAMCVGPILVFGLVLVMNRYASDLDQEKPVKDHAA
jgi:hypothetical protein